MLYVGIAGFAGAVRAETDKRLEVLLQQMTLAEKVGQMTQLTLEAVASDKESANTRLRLDAGKLKRAIVDYHVGSILNSWESSLSLEQWHHVISEIQTLAITRTRLAIPVLYGIDAVHGHHFLKNATVFPHNLALAATWDPQHVRSSNRITAREVRASGIPWNFSPVLDVARQPLWSRFFETFGEDRYLVTEMGLAAIQGQQGEGEVIAPDRVAACAKHFLGYSVPLSGKDRTPAWIPERMLREIFLPPFRAAIDAGVMTLMINSGEINGIPVHASHALLTGLLREELGFQGVAVTDWEDIIKLHKIHRVASSEREAVRQAILAGVDMSMTPNTLSFHDHLVDLVRKGEISEQRIDESVRRILKLKFRLNLFDAPLPDPQLASGVGSAESAVVSQKAAEAAMTLLKNENALLPLKKSARILLTGPGADSRAALHGAWSYSWQGHDEALYPQATPGLLQVLREVGGSGNIEYVPGASYRGIIDLQAVGRAAAGVDVIVVAIAEKPSVEQPGNIEDLELPHAQQQLVNAARATGKPVVLVLLLNRPRILRQIEPAAGAILLAYYPGMAGARAITNVLYGDINPGGKLPFTYPRYSGSTETYDYKVSESSEHAFAWTTINPQWPFGFGLSYTTFEYSGLGVDKPEIDADGEVQVSVTVTNTGDRAGSEVVQLYVRDLYASVTPANRKLAGFRRVYLQPRESRVVRFSLGPGALSFIGADNRPRVEAGRFQAIAGSLTADFSVR